MIKRQKIETIAAKYHKDRDRINLSNKKEKNYKGDTRNNMDLNQANDKYLLQI